MNPDEFKQAWKAQPASRTRVTLKADALLNEVRRNRDTFRRTIFWRDVREVGVAAILVPVFIHGGWNTHWTLFLSAFSCFVVGAYMLLDRRGQRKKTPELHGSLKDCAAVSLAEVNHQIWLLKNVHWWYLLPLGIPIVIFFAWTSLSSPGPVIFQILFLLFLVGFVGLLYVGIYWLNQSAVKKTLNPRRLELEELLTELESQDHACTMKKEKPLAPLVLVLIACGLTVIGSLGYALAQDTSVRPSEDLSDPTSEMLEAVRLKHEFPALAAAVVVDGKLVTANAVGFRKRGGPEAVTVNDKFHLGSVTKSMTSTIAAMLVEQGKIEWTTTIGDSFDDHGAEIHADYRDVTLEQLLAHRGGAPGNAPRDLWSQAWRASGPPHKQRMEFVKGLLARKPETKPGTKKAYSNQGYAIAGVMLENATGEAWEDLMRSMLFEPLGMSTAGFGAPATVGEVDQPWGHSKKPLTGITPVPPGPRADNPPAIGPAGTVHCSLPDLAKYVMFHLSGEQGTSELLRAESFKKLHTSAGDEYALGWSVLERPWAGGRALMHNGSNTMFYVVVWMAPDRNSAVIVATNAGGSNVSFYGCDEVAGNLIREHF